MNKSHLVVRIHSYSSLAILDNLKLHNIVVYNFKHVDDYDFVFEVDLYNEKKIKKIYPDCQIINRQGIFGRIKNCLINKITLIALIISLMFFFDFNSRISNVNIIGTNTRLNELIYARSQELGLTKYARIPKFQYLVDVENILKKEYIDDIDFVEVRQNGTIIKIKYQTRQDSVDVPEKNNSLIARKNGLIPHNVIHIGAYGQVYAKTWTIIELNDKSTNDEADTFFNAMQKAKATMCAGFTLEEKILEEKVLKYQYQSNKFYLKVHFTCLENIGI